MPRELISGGTGPIFRRVWLIVGWILVLAVVYLSVAHVVVRPPGLGGDKLGHLIAYGALTFWFSQLDQGRGARAQIVLAFVALGVSLEFVQGRLPYRSYDEIDMLANTAGVALGWLASPPRTPNILLWLEALVHRRGR